MEKGSIHMKSTPRSKDLESSFAESLASLLRPGHQSLSPSSLRNSPTFKLCNLLPHFATTDFIAFFQNQLHRQLNDNHPQKRFLLAIWRDFERLDCYVKHCLPQDVFATQLIRSLTYIMLFDTLDLINPNLRIDERFKDINDPVLKTYQDMAVLLNHYILLDYEHSAAYKVYQTALNLINILCNLWFDSDPSDVCETFSKLFQDDLNELYNAEKHESPLKANRRVARRVPFEEIARANREFVPSRLLCLQELMHSDLDLQGRSYESKRLRSALLPICHLPINQELPFFNKAQQLSLNPELMLGLLNHLSQAKDNHVTRFIKTELGPNSLTKLLKNDEVRPRFLQMLFDQPDMFEWLLEHYPQKCQRYFQGQDFAKLQIKHSCVKPGDVSNQIKRLNVLTRVYNKMPQVAHLVKQILDSPYVVGELSKQPDQALAVLRGVSSMFDQRRRNQSQSLSYTTPPKKQTTSSFKRSKSGNLAGCAKLLLQASQKNRDNTIAAKDTQQLVNWFVDTCQAKPKSLPHLLDTMFKRGQLASHPYLKALDQDPSSMLKVINKLCDIPDQSIRQRYLDVFLTSKKRVKQLMSSDVCGDFLQSINDNPRLHHYLESKQVVQALNKLDDKAKPKHPMAQAVLQAIDVSQNPRQSGAQGVADAVKSLVKVSKDVSYIYDTPIQTYLNRLLTKKAWYCFKDSAFTKLLKSPDHFKQVLSTLQELRPIQLANHYLDHLQSWCPSQIEKRPGDSQAAYDYAELQQLTPSQRYNLFRQQARCYTQTPPFSAMAQSSFKIDSETASNYEDEYLVWRGLKAAQRLPYAQNLKEQISCIRRIDRALHRYEGQKDSNELLDAISINDLYEPLLNSIERMSKTANFDQLIGYISQNNNELFQGLCNYVQNPILGQALKEKGSRANSTPSDATQNTSQPNHYGSKQCTATPTTEKRDRVVTRLSQRPSILPSTSHDGGESPPIRQLVF